jgi:hypothetical protein
VLGRFYDDYITSPFQALHTPFVLVRFYRQRTGDYQAPLLHQFGGEVVPNTYSVKLHPGYSMEEHVRFVGAELQRSITFEFRHGPGYHAELDEAMLQAVRADVGVDRVVPARMIRNDDPLDVYDPEERKAVIASLLGELDRSLMEDQKTQT